MAVVGALAASSLAVSTGDAEAHKKRHHHSHHHRDLGSGVAAGLVFGLAAGALAHAITAPRSAPPPPAYYPPMGYRPVPMPAASAHSQWCASSFPSYDFATNTIVDGYGVRRPCFSPY